MRTVKSKKANKNISQRLASENIRFSSLFAAGDVSLETPPAAKSEEKRMFSQATQRSDRLHKALHFIKDVQTD